MHAIFMLFLSIFSYLSYLGHTKGISSRRKAAKGHATHVDIEILIVTNNRIQTERLRNIQDAYGAHAYNKILRAIKYAVQAIAAGMPWPQPTPSPQPSG